MRAGICDHVGQAVRAETARDSRALVQPRDPRSRPGAHDPLARHRARAAVARPFAVAAQRPGARSARARGGRGRTAPAELLHFVIRAASKEASMAVSVKQMMEAANAAVPRVTPAQAREMIAKGNTLVVDVRDGTEVAASGKVGGAVHVSRGMLEFRADSDSPYHDKNFAKDKTLIVYCASGGRSALAGKVLKDMGYDQVYNLGAFKDWAESGGAIEK